MTKERIKELEENFLVNSDDTGRFIVYSPKTGIRYFIEPLEGGEKRNWGNVIPGEDRVEKVTGKGVGAVHSSESLINENQGFTNVQVLPANTSPHGTIEDVDKLRYEQGFRPGVTPKLQDTSE